MGGSDAEEEAETEKESCTPRLPLLSVPPMATLLLLQSPERSGTLTPPLHTHSAAVPFRWEQEPGKPIPCTALVPFSNPSDFLPKCLELPPSRVLVPSPTTVLDGPYVRSNRFRSPSFRNIGGSSSTDCYGGSFGSERGVLGALILSRGRREVVNDRGGWFGSWKKKNKAFKREVTAGSGGGSHVFPSSSSSDAAAMSNLKRSGSFSALSHGKSRFWGKICEGLKQAVPWRSKKLKKEGSALSL